MSFAPYHCDIAEFLVKMENFNPHAHVTTVVMREMIEDQLQMEAEERLSMGQLADNREWLEAVRTFI